MKVIILGNPQVGKTAIIERLVNNRFNPDQKTTIGVAYNNLCVQNKKMTIWDTAGQERFGPIVKKYYRGANIVMLVYSTENLSTFDKLRDDVEYVKDNMESGSDYKFLLIGNKIDLSDDTLIRVSKNKMIKEFHDINPDKSELNYVFCSAKTGEGINKIMEFLVGSSVKVEDAAIEELITIEDEKTEIRCPCFF